MSYKHSSKQRAARSSSYSAQKISVMKTQCRERQLWCKSRGFVRWSPEFLRGVEPREMGWRVVLGAEHSSPLIPHWKTDLHKMWFKRRKGNTEIECNIWNCRPVQEKKGIKCVIKQMKNNLKWIIDKVIDLDIIIPPAKDAENSAHTISQHSMNPTDLSA